MAPGAVRFESCLHGAPDLNNSKPDPILLPTVPVEDQDHEHPPKRVVQHLFAQHGQRYQATVDAPLILGASSYTQIADLCAQCFKPFVGFLEALAPEAA